MLLSRKVLLPICMSLIFTLHSYAKAAPPDDHSYCSTPSPMPMPIERSLLQSWELLSRSHFDSRFESAQTEKAKAVKDQKTTLFFTHLEKMASTLGTTLEEVAKTALEDLEPFTQSSLAEIESSLNKNTLAIQQKTIETKNKIIQKANSQINELETRAAEKAILEAETELTPGAHLDTHSRHSISEVAKETLKDEVRAIEEVRNSQLQKVEGLKEAKIAHLIEKATVKIEKLNSQTEEIKAHLASIRDWASVQDEEADHFLSLPFVEMQEMTLTATPSSPSSVNE